jgi:hypothetical protein
MPENNKPHSPPSKELYSLFLHTGDIELNRLFSRRRHLGICVGQIECAKADLRKKKRIGFQDTSIIVVEGDAGTGKTTLALQIAAAVANPTPWPEGGSNAVALKETSPAEMEEIKSKKKKPADIEKLIDIDPSSWRVVFICLEQSCTSVLNTVRHFGFGGIFRDDRFPDLGEASIDTSAPKANAAREKRKANAPGPNQVRIFNLSPLPLSGVSADEIFAERFAQLRHMVDEVTKEDDENNTLFVLFRCSKVPLIATVEQTKHYESHAQPVEEAPAFLADVCVRLGRDSQGSYLKTFIEVTKSRVCLQALGKHLYKTRTFQSAQEADASDRTGLVVYPSIDFTLSRSRIDPDEPRLIFKIDTDLKALDLEEPVNTPACFALLGPAGTHKLALGLNLGLSQVQETAHMPLPLNPRLLIINFGGQGDIDFKGVAWVGSLQDMRYLNVSSKNQVTNQGSKHTLKTFIPQKQGAVLAPNCKKSSVSVLTFQIGQLTEDVPPIVES